MLPPQEIAIILESKIQQLVVNQPVKVIPQRNNRIKPPEFSGRFLGTVKTDIKSFNNYPFPVRIILVAQTIVGRQEPKIIRIPNFLIQDIQ